MPGQINHTFHIPVMGLAFTIDTPVKVAKFGISSVLSIIEDQLMEQMREVICRNENIPYTYISEDEPDGRSLRVTAYLNLLDQVVKRQIETIKNEDFETDNDINQYFQMLPDSAGLKLLYGRMLLAKGDERKELQNQLRSVIVAGSIDVNIMTKLDKTNYDKAGNPLPTIYSDAHTALRGYANSTLNSSIVFSAGMNPRLFGYCESFSDFFPDQHGLVRKKIILKVSDYRSAQIQGKYLAKKGLWVSEFRIESGINCGGHAFVAEGLLMGPILEEFKNRRDELFLEQLQICQEALENAGRNKYQAAPELRITAQGGIGTADENKFLLDHYQLDSTGWGSPFLMVPEATNVDAETLNKLVHAKKEDYYLSHASPLGVPFSNFRHTSSEIQRKARIEKNRPGSPCYKKFLSSNTEFTEKPICTASREYQHLKIKQLTSTISDEKILEMEIDKVTEKDCLCEGLGASALINSDSKLSHKLSAVTICPGPNLAYFSGVFSLSQMVDHIYGRATILNDVPRRHVFLNEIQLYIDYLKKETGKYYMELSNKEQSYFVKFKENLLKGIEYYHSISDVINNSGSEAYEQMALQLSEMKEMLYSHFFSSFTEMKAG